MHFKILFSMIFASAVYGCGSLPSPPDARERPVHSPIRAEAVLQALLALGIEYHPGGRSPVTGFDCSGLVAHVYREAYGMRLPHNARAQSEAGRAVSLAEIEAGDLLFYDTQSRPFSHVGIYLGDGRFVHAPKAGARVRVERMENPYWIQRFNGARRVHASL